MQTNRDRAEAEPEMALLFSRYAPDLLRYVRMHVATPEDAEDLIVEVFLGALQQEKFGALSESAKSMWLWRVTRNKVIDAYRQAKTRRQAILKQAVTQSIEKEIFSPEFDVLRQEDYQELSEHLERLPELQQEILRMRFGQGLSCGEIAAKLGKQENAVRVALSRTLNRLRSSYQLSRGEAIK